MDHLDKLATENKCTVEGNMTFYNNIVEPIRTNWSGEKLKVYRYFESIVRFFGSLPCAICNSENNSFIEQTEDKFRIFISPLNCLDEVYTLQLALQMVEFLDRITRFLDDLLCLLKGKI